MIRSPIRFPLPAIAALLCTAELRAGDQEIEVRAVITGQEFCLGMPTGFSLEQLPPDAVTLRLRVNLFYRNKGSGPLILPLFEDPTIILSRSLNDVTQQKNQAAIGFGLPRRPLDLADGAVDLDRPGVPFFRVIPPGPESPWSLTEDMAIRVHNPAAKRVQAELLGKTVFVQLDLNHWMIPERLVQDLQRRWHDYGIVWIGRVRTQPLEVAIPRSPKTAKCSSQFRVD